MVRKYETVVVFDGSLPEETIAKEHKAVEEFLSSKFDFHKTDVWGKRDLAYEIDKKKTGYYCLFIYSGEGNMNEAMTNLFKLNDKVIRHMTVLHEELKVPKKKDVSEEVNGNNVDAEEGEE